MPVKYLIKPPHGTPARPGAGITIIVLYFILGVPMSAYYCRVLYQVATDPGYVPRAADSGSRRWRKDKRERERDLEKPVAGSLPDSHHNSPNHNALDDDRIQRSPLDKAYLDRAAILEGREPSPRGLERFYQHDVYECDVDGLPRWCSTCCVWKPDRSHHSSEIGCCVYKMDHYCPWAGGMVAERNFKFFIQFLWCTACFCVFVLIVMAYFTAEVRKKVCHLLTTGPLEMNELMVRTDWRVQCQLDRCHRIVWPTPPVGIPHTS